MTPGFPLLLRGYQRLFHLKREIAWVVLGQVLAFVGGFAAVSLLSRTMGADGYGQLALGMTVAGTVNLLVYGPLSQIVLRFFSAYQERDRLDSYFWAVKRAHVAFGLFFLVLTGVLGALGLAYGADWALLAAAGLAFGLVGGINGTFIALQSAVRQQKLVAIHKAADVWLRVGLALALLFVLGRQGQVALIGFCLGTLLVTLSQYRYAARLPGFTVAASGASDANRQERRRSLGEFFAYGRPFVIWAGISAIGMYADVWILQQVFGSGEVGVYAALYQVANAPIIFIVGVVNQLSVPVIFKRAGAMATPEQSQASTRLLNLTVLVLIGLLGPVLAASYLLSSVILGVLTPGPFVQHHALLWVLVLGLSVFNLAQFLCTKGFYSNRPEIYLIPKTIHAAIFLLSAYFSALSHGIAGVAWALCGSSAVYLLAVIVVNSRIKYVPPAYEHH